MNKPIAFNERVALMLREAADLLEQQAADGFRINAYRRAADFVTGFERSLLDVLREEGEPGLQRLPSVGSGIAAAIREVADTGCWARLQRLRGQTAPEKLLQMVPGIGPRLARRIHDHLGIDTLEGLEVAAHDGRLAEVPGVGKRRAAGARASLTEMLQRSHPLRHRGQGPPAALLLEVDREYREAARAGKLVRIAPRRFNPAAEAWLSIMHVDQGAWHFTALFSNTARAHELGRTNDWVVIYFYDADHDEGQCTVVTESRGSLAGLRVVRGQEAECREFYRRRERDAPRGG